MQRAKLTDQEIRFYQRQISLNEIGLEGQEKLKAAKVLVVGAGGLGSSVLQHLALSGVGTLGILDIEMVQENNLQRQIFKGGNDLGKLKTILASERLRHLNPFVHTNIINLRLTSKNAEKIIKDYDLLIDTSNNNETRLVIDEICMKTSKPWVFGSIDRFEGKIAVFNFHNSANFSDYISQVISKEPEPNLASPMLGILLGIIGSLQANEVIKIITGYGEALSGKILVANLLTPSFYYTSL
jgi:sulfur-carrier protein adenylyltransferase/sulfurtransferase